MKVKKTIYLDEVQAKRVKQLARAAKTTESEIIRRAIDAYARNERAAAGTIRRNALT